MGLTGSAIHRARVCLPSELLPRTLHAGSRWATWGRVGHKFLCEVSTLGREEALDNAPPEYREALALIEVDKLPVDPSKFAPEVVYRYDVRADEAREVARGESDRPYANDESPGVIWGTADVAGLTEDAVAIIDFKFGFGDVVPAAKNWQLRTYALMACRAHGRSKAIVFLCRLRDDGTPWYDRAELGMLELDAAAQELFELCDRIEVAKALGREHWIPIEGPHCRFCKAFNSCPAKASLATALGTGQIVPYGEITPRNAPLIVERLWAAKHVIAKVEESLDEYARAHPIDLGDGWVYAEKKLPRESIDPLLAQPILKERGLEGAIVTIPKVTKEGLEDEVRKQVAAKYPKGPKPKGILGKTRDGALAALRLAGAATTTYAATVTRWRPKPGEISVPALPDSSGAGPAPSTRTEAALPVENGDGQPAQEVPQEGLA